MRDRRLDYKELLPTYPLINSYTFYSSREIAVDIAHILTRSFNSTISWSVDKSNLSTFISTRPTETMFSICRLVDINGHFILKASESKNTKFTE